MLFSVAAFTPSASLCFAAEGPAVEAIKILVEPNHPWRPPFGLDRVGLPITIAVEANDESLPKQDFYLVSYVEGKEIARSALGFQGQPSGAFRVTLSLRPTELAVVTASADGTDVELARQVLELAPFEADAAARPEEVRNPVDLGTILPPSDWLLLAEGQRGTVEVAAISHNRDLPGAQAIAWFESVPEARTTVDIALIKSKRAQCAMSLPSLPATVERDVLHVHIVSADGAILWEKNIQTTLARRIPELPRFGAVETKLRYDAPISVRNADGTFTSLPYADGWDPKLEDIIVALPNGTRFVFWRGSCYIPFWAGKHNTGLSYEWAENTPPPDAVDCVEPLMDKELRYGRVQIVESTAARVHVRWTYQSCDLNYRVWGDSAVEDYYFYPDGFGTRVLTIQMDPASDYELSEFIVLTPAATYPFSVLPDNMMDMLFVDGVKRELKCPFSPEEQAEVATPRGIPAIYRARLHKDEPLAAIYFSPLNTKLPHTFYAPFFDQGQLATPCYWGSHWPLARGNSTGWAIDNRIGLTPCHNSVVSWYKNRPEPIRTARLDTLDTLGQSKRMLRQTWAWLIGMSDADDERLLQWAHSFTAPPSLELEGALLEAEPYVPERRALRLIVKDKRVCVTIKPCKVCVNPIFELLGAPESLTRVQLAGRTLETSEYAWDGHTLWLDATLRENAQLTVEFQDS